jgi:hypothetical protein
MKRGMGADANATLCERSQLKIPPLHLVLSQMATDICECMKIESDR